MEAVCRQFFSFFLFWAGFWAGFLGAHWGEFEGNWQKGFGEHLSSNHHLSSPFFFIEPSLILIEDHEVSLTNH